MSQSKEKKSFKDTLNLPRTDFPIRSNPEVEDKKMIKRWEKEHLFTAAFELNAGSTLFVLHDGPPYANGPIHLGHAYNKILKDIIGKSQRMQKKHVPIVPGWDCHGLPIELKVTEELKGKEVSKQEFIHACRAYAQKWVDVQRDEFKDLGVLMDWSNPYLTMNFGYEASILQAFGIFVQKGFIERKNKTVVWCASCQTVLANAEVEYQERKDPSIYVTFPVEQSAVDVLFPDLKGKPVSLAIWTTTPWTLPLNRAVLVNPTAEYVVLELQDNYVLIGADLAQTVCNLMELPCVLVARITGEQLLKSNPIIKHPFVKDLEVPLLASDTVSTKEGTAFVHCAPGCGPEDYEIGVRNKLEIFSPVSPAGSYTSGIKPVELEGMSVKDGQIWVIKTLAKSGTLLFKKSIRHSYPHCWRCRNPLIFRATKQWFCDLAKHDLKERTLKRIQTLTTYPPKAYNRLRATLEGRLEWCLSRQRVWGAPIPALLCKNCDYAFTDQSFIDVVAQGVSKEGIEYWNSVSVETLVDDLVCPECNKNEWKKETDILDVWFDSGISHYAVLLKRPSLTFPANLYLEGKDQHRGWFQSSLLTSMVIEEEPAMRSILTHGYTVDEKGHKMSKSLGNVVSPWEVTKTLGVDGLRLWTSSIDYTDDPIVSVTLLKNVQEVFRKIRNTSRFLLSNLYDFEVTEDTVALDQMYAIDQYALQELYRFNNEIIKQYNNYDFTAVFHALAQYCSVGLSAFYLDVIKDRLYVEEQKGIPRRSAQTACWYILDTLTHLIAPILSFTAEQISDYYQKDKKESIHLQSFVHLINVWEYRTGKNAQEPVYTLYSKTGSKEKTETDARMEQVWNAMRSIRSALLKAIEQLREQGIIKHPLEATLTMYLDPKSELLQQVGNYLASLPSQTAEQFLKEFTIVSNVKLTDSSEGLKQSELEGLWVKVDKAQGSKCPRCWHWEVTDHPDGLCVRCQSVLSG